MRAALEKLRIKPGMRLWVINPGLTVTGAEVVAGPPAEAVLLFANSRGQLESLMPEAVAATAGGKLLWVAYPKLSSKAAGDLSRDVIREVAPKYGLDTVSQVALDETWSALRLRPLKP